MQKTEIYFFSLIFLTIRHLELGYFIFSCTYTGFHINRFDGLVYRVPESKFNRILQRQLFTFTFSVLQIYSEKRYIKNRFIKSHTPVAQKVADELVFRRFQDEGVEFLKSDQTDPPEIF